MFGSESCEENVPGGLNEREGETREREEERHGIRSRSIKQTIGNRGPGYAYKRRLSVKRYIGFSGKVTAVVEILPPLRGGTRDILIDRHIIGGFDTCIDWVSLGKPLSLCVPLRNCVKQTSLLYYVARGGKSSVEFF